MIIIIKTSVFPLIPRNRSARRIRGIGGKLRKLRIINMQRAGFLFSRVETDFSKFYIYLFIYLFNNCNLFCVDEIYFTINLAMPIQK